jgi:LmbE family N-acetylglucosaminyl deacetylase
MRHVYLSPHLDDAVLSCGGAIHRHRARGQPVIVITFFAGEFGGERLSPFALEQHAYWGNPLKPMELRRAEDLAALALLDTEAKQLDYLDAVYRADANGHWLYVDVQALFDQVLPGDPLGMDGGAGLSDRLTELISPDEPSVIYAPLAVGHHVDHQLTRLAARSLAAIGYSVAFYEDVPYAEQPGATEAALAAAGATDWREETIPLVPADLSAKVAAVAYYRTQMGILFRGVEAMAGRIWAFAATRTAHASLAERIWWPEDA